MNKDEFRHRLAAAMPEPSLHFSNHVDCVLEGITRKAEKQEKAPSKQKAFISRQMSNKALVFALIAVMMCTVAFAATQWGIIDTLRFMLGNQPLSDDTQAQKIFHQETINDVEITIHEAVYDGRTLFLQYSYRMLDESEPFGTLDANGNLQEGISSNALKKLKSHNVGWWIDNIWIDGRCMDMASGSGTVITGTMVPGEIMVTEYWRLDNLDAALSGKVDIALPIGEFQPAIEYFKSEHSEKYDAEGNLLQPEKGVVSFTFDIGNVKDRVATVHTNIETVLPDVTAKVTEAAFSPLMTYITLELNGDSDTSAAYILSLQLVDGNGKMMFPNYSGCKGVGDDWAECCYPYISSDIMPEELWLAPMNGETADLSKAIRVK